MEDYFELRKIWEVKRQKASMLIAIASWSLRAKIAFFGTAIGLIVLAQHYTWAVWALIIFAIGCGLVGVYESSIAIKYHRYDSKAQKQDPDRYDKEVFRQPYNRK